MIQFEIVMDEKMELRWALANCPRQVQNDHDFVGVNFWIGAKKVNVSYGKAITRQIVLAYVPLWGRNG